jgi:hypothetical protein
MAEKVREQQAADASADVFWVHPHVVELAGRGFSAHGIETNDRFTFGRAVHPMLGDELGSDCSDQLPRAA